VLEVDSTKEESVGSLGGRESCVGVNFFHCVEGLRMKIVNKAGGVPMVSCGGKELEHADGRVTGEFLFPDNRLSAV
jgi:hypothetical protein